MPPTAKEVMNPRVLTVSSDMTVHELAAFLTENGISGAPVIDERGHLVGVVSVTDIAESEVEEGELVPDPASPDSYVRGWEDTMNPEDLRRLHMEGRTRQVRDIMTPAVYAVEEDTPVSSLAKTMIAGRVHRLLVMQDQHIVGIVTSLDMLKLLCDRG